MVWDRSWACESVYSGMLGRENRVGCGWFAEWYMGRAVQAAGLPMIWTGPSWERLQERRDETDLPVHPREEQGEYVRYGTTFDWDVMDFRSSRTHEEIYADFDLKEASGLLVRLARLHRSPVPPPVYAGPWPPRVLFVGDRRNEKSDWPWAWLPFSTKRTTRLARCLGTDAFKCGWANQADFPAVQLRNLVLTGVTKLIVCCGEAAEVWVHSTLHELRRRCVDVRRASTIWRWSLDLGEGASVDVLRVPHPGALYRFGRYEPAIPAVEAYVQEAVRGVLYPGTARAATEVAAPLRA